MRPGKHRVQEQWFFRIALVDGVEAFPQDKPIAGALETADVVSRFGDRIAPRGGGFAGMKFGTDSRKRGAARSAFSEFIQVVLVAGFFASPMGAGGGLLIK